MRQARPAQHHGGSGQCSHPSSPLLEEGVPPFGVPPGTQPGSIAIARKLLVGIRHILQKEVADRHADENSIAASMFKLAYEIGVKNLPEGKSAKTFTREQMDRLGVGRDLTVIPWGTKQVELPHSQLTK